MSGRTLPVAWLRQTLEFDPHRPAAEAEWIKHNLAPRRGVAVHGYCGRPPQQDCPHPNACMTCPDFQTTPQFLHAGLLGRDDEFKVVLVLSSVQRGSPGRQPPAGRHQPGAVIVALEAID